MSCIPRDLNRCLKVLLLWAVVAVLSAATTTASATSFTVQGQVVDAQGDPVADARVDLRPLATPYEQGRALLDGAEPLGASLDATRTDSEGRFALTAPVWGLFRVVVDAPGHLPMAHRLLPLLHDAALPKLTLTPDEGAVVEVRDAAGQAAAEASVVVRWRQGPGLPWDKHRGWYPELRLGTTEKDGATVVPYIAGEHVDVVVFPSDHRPWMGQLSPKDDALEVTLEANNRLQNIAMKDGTVPSRDALVMRRGWPVALADAEGHVQLSTSQNPLDLLVLTPDGQQHQVSWKPGDTAVSLGAPQWTPGRVVQDRAETDNPSVAEEGVPGARIWDLYTLRQVEADAEGRFRWPSHGPNPRLRAAKPGFAARVQPEKKEAERNASGAWRITLQEGRVLRGRVVDLRGHGVPGAVLEVRPERITSEATRQMTIDADGTFQVRGLTVGMRYVLQAKAQGYAPLRVKAEPWSPASSADQELTLTLHPGPVLFGRAVDAASGPLEGVRVELFGVRRADGSRFIESDGDERSAMPTFSDADGRFEVRDVPPGLHTLALRAEGYAPRVLITVPVDTAVGRHDLGDLTLQNAVAQDLLVVDEGGQPVPGARVQLAVMYPNNGRHGYPQALRELVNRKAKTDAEGRLRFGGLHPAFGLGLSIRHPHLMNQFLQVQPSDEVLEVMLESGATLRGRVVDPQGRGLEGAGVSAHVQLVQQGGVSTEAPKKMYSSRSRADGTFEIHAVAPGRLRLTAQLRGYLGGEVSAEIDSKDVVDGLTVELLEALELHGRVLRHDGEPAAFVGVSVQPEGTETKKHSQSTRSRSDGRFKLTSLRPGGVLLKAKDDRGGRASQNVRVRPDMPPVTLILEPGQVLAGRVIDSDGQGVHGARVEFIGPGPLPGLHVEKDGRFLTPLEQGGRYTVVATRLDLGRTQVDVEVPEGGSVHDVELVLRPTGRIVGNLRGLQPDDLPTVILRAQFQDPLQGTSTIIRTGEVDLEGGLVIEGIFPGSWRVLADIRGTARRAGRTVEVLSDGETVNVDLDLGGPGLTLTGKIMYNGFPAKEAWIDPGQVYADSSGYFRLEGLQPGPYRLLLYGPWKKYVYEGEIYADQEVEIVIDTPPSHQR